jgi:hypothetical protein
MRCKE